MEDSKPSFKQRSEQCIKGLSYSSVLVALLAVGGAYVYFDRTSTLNKFSAAVTETLCDSIIPKHQAEATTPPTPHATPAMDEIKPSKESSHNPIPYDAKGKRNFIWPSPLLRLKNVMRLSCCFCDYLHVLTFDICVEINNSSDFVYVHFILRHARLHVHFK